MLHLDIQARINLGTQCDNISLIYQFISLHANKQRTTLMKMNHDFDIVTIHTKNVGLHQPKIEKWN